MRVDDALEFLVFGLAKTGTTKGEKDDTRGIDSLATSVLDSDEWRPAFSELSRSEVPFSFLTYFWTTSDVVPLINGELESFSLRERVGRNKEPTHRRFHDNATHPYKCKRMVNNNIKRNHNRWLKDDCIFIHSNGFKVDF